MFNTWKQLDANSELIKALYVIIGLLFILCILFFWGWRSAPKHLTVYIPPDISEATTQKPNVIPKPSVYAFAFQIFTAINTWSQSGTDDYPKEIADYRYYLTIPFHSALIADYKQRSSEGSLSRTRLMTGFSGKGYSNQSVKVLGPNSWAVTLTMHVVERVGNTVVKDVLIDYPLRVVRTQMSINYNPWGLALDGFVKPPHRLKTFV